MTEDEAIKALGKLLEGKSEKATAKTGACVYTAGAKTYCAVLEKSACDQLKGAWTEGKSCP